MTEEARIKSLKALRGAEAACTHCPLYKSATQVVPGEGLARARLMMVGEEPGDQEDKQGHPFLGPAGRMLATVHPSFILRIEDEADKRAQYRQLAADLNTCSRFLTKAA